MPPISLDVGSEGVMTAGRQRAMTTFLLSLLVLVAVGSVVAFFAVRHAPEGFEDVTGFHAVRAARDGQAASRRDELHGDHLAGGLA